MRTYTRRKPEYQVIDGVEELCRLCLDKAVASVPIFTDDSDVCATLPMRIMICVGLEISREECLPNTICMECFKELERCYTFRKKCEVTYQKLKSHVLAVKRIENNKAMAMKQNDSTAQKDSTENLQHPGLTLTNQQVRLVNVDNVQLHGFQALNGLAKMEETQAQEQYNEVQISTTADLSAIMSTMLIQLGVMRQDENGLVLVDDSLRTVELEGEDNTRIVLQLVEEVEDETSTLEIEEDSNKEKLPVQEVKIKAPPSEKQAVLSKSNSSKGAVCVRCGKRFVSRSVLSRHARVHSGERPFACACGKAFAQRSVLARHELVHAEKRPFACTRCPKSFTQRGALESHSRRHEPPNTRPMALHRCAVCDKVFLYASGLSRHMAQHAGRAFSCTDCRRVFSDTSSLRRHRQNKHAVNATESTHQRVSAS